MELGSVPSTVWTSQGQGGGDPRSDGRSLRGNMSSAGIVARKTGFLLKADLGDQTPGEGYEEFALIPRVQGRGSF